MRNLVLFGSKYGTTARCADKLKMYMDGNTDVIDIKDNPDISLDNYSRIIIGSSIYAGRFNKEIKIFIEKNREKLMSKKFGLFICCMSDDKKVQEQYKENLPEEILKKAVIKSNFGGEFKFSKMNFIEKSIIKMIAKKDGTLGKVDGKTDISKINEDTIKRFARVMSE